jgi:hypothetical protein
MNESERLILDAFILLASFVLTSPAVTPRQDAEIGRLLKRMKPYVDRAAKRRK